MRTFLADIFPKIQSYSQKLDDLALLSNKHWVSIDNINTNKTVYIFRDNNKLVVSTNGKVEKAKWEYLSNKSLLIDKKDECYLFKHGFLDQNIFALKVDSSNEYAVFVNEDNYMGDLNSIEKVMDFLNEKYLDPNLQSLVEDTMGQKIVSNNHQEYIPIVTADEQKALDEQSKKESQEIRNVTFCVILFFLILILIALAVK